MVPCLSRVRLHPSSETQEALFLHILRPGQREAGEESMMDPIPAPERRPKPSRAVLPPACDVFLLAPPNELREGVSAETETERFN
ncbi:unnamed protein product [Arctogadus glacialis]